jgi:hypothetical protein
MVQTARFQENFRRLAMIDEGVVEDAAGLGLGLVTTSALDPKIGWTLARPHARSGDRVALAAYLGGTDAFDQAMAEFAETYVDQDEHDYAALQNAVEVGKVDAATGI